MSTSGGSTPDRPATGIRLNPRRSAAAILLLAGLYPLSAANSDESFGVKVVVRYVDVVVTNRKGEPVKGLRPEEFEIYQDGVKRPVTDFRTRTLGQETPSEQGRPYLVILFDVKHMSFGELDRPRKAALKIIEERLDGKTRAAILVLRHQLEVAQGFTTDRHALDETARRILWWKGEREVDAKFREMGRDEELPVSIYPRYAESGPSHSLYSVLESIGQALSGRKGSKSVILFSEGISSDLKNPEVASAYRRMIAALNGGSVSVITVDAEGLRGRLGRSDRNFRALPQVNLVGTHGKSGLKALARETGGDALIGSSNMAGWLGKTLDARQVSYLIGFEPADKGDSYSRLDVKVRKRGLKVHFRRGFPLGEKEGKVPPENVAPILDQVMRSWILERGRSLRFKGYAFPVNGRESLVALAVLAGEREREPAGAGDPLRLAIIHTRSRSQLSIEESLPQGGRLLAIQRLRFGDYVGKAASLSLSDGTVGSTETLVSVPHRRKIVPMLSEPTLLEPAAGRFILRKGFEQEGASSLFTLDGEGYYPNLDGTIAPSDKPLVLATIWGMQSRNGQVKGRLTLRENGRLLASLPIREAAPLGTRQSLPLYLRLPALSSGQHKINVVLKDTIAKKQVSQELSVSVKAEIE